MHCVLQSNIFIAVIGENRIVRLIWALSRRMGQRISYDWFSAHSRRLKPAVSSNFGQFQSLV